jgi:hypothetical protein
LSPIRVSRGRTSAEYPVRGADEIPKIILVFAPTARGLIYTSNVVESLQRDEASACS